MSNQREKTLILAQQSYIPTKEVSYVGGSTNL